MLRHWVERWQEARTFGEMRLRPDRYPALFLPVHGVLGTSDYDTDLELDEAPQCSEGHPIKGQLLYLKEGTEALPILDRFEGFFPGSRSEYWRVAVSVITQDGPIACWTYTGVGRPVPEWPLLEEWPPPGLIMAPEPYQHGL